VDGNSYFSLIFKRKEARMGDKGKKDKSKREEQKKSKHSVKEKKKQKDDKSIVIGINER
jgi:hypothetical protein